MEKSALLNNMHTYTHRQIRWLPYALGLCPPRHNKAFTTFAIQYMKQRCFHMLMLPPWQQRSSLLSDTTLCDYALVGRALKKHMVVVRMCASVILKVGTLISVTAEKYAVKTELQLHVHYTIIRRINWLDFRAKALFSSNGIMICSRPWRIMLKNWLIMLFFYACSCSYYALLL